MHDFSVNNSYPKWYSLNICLCLESTQSVNDGGIELLSVLCLCILSVILSTTFGLLILAFKAIYRLAQDCHFLSRFIFT